MQEFEEGPLRRVSRNQRRRSASNSKKHTWECKTETKETEINGSTGTVEGKKCSKVDKSPVASTWFASSFHASKFSTPKTRRDRRKTSESDCFNTSDVLFAELDLEEIVSQRDKTGTSQANNTSNHQNSNTKQNKSITQDSTIILKESNRVSNLKSERSHKNEGTVDASLSESRQSQYFPAKFASYKPAQVSKDCGKREIIVENNVTSKTNGCDTSFSFSFVDAVSDDRKDPAASSTDKAGRKSFNSYVIRPVSKNCVSLDDSMCLSKTEWNTKEIVTSTQLCDTQDKQHTRYRCTPFKQPTQTENEGQEDFDITCLKDHERESRIRCTPYVKDVHDGTQTGSQITGDSKIRCTPYFKDGHSQIVTVTQDKSNSGQLEDSQLLSTAHCQRDQTLDPYIGTPVQTQTESQIPATGLCDMTGLIVDTQKQAGKDQNISGDCDIFGDSLQDSVLVTQVQELDNDCLYETQTGKTKSEKCNKTKVKTCGSNQDGKASSRTLTESDTSKSKPDSRKRSIEDDIDSIFLQSQERRQSKKKARNSLSDAHSYDSGRDAASVSKSYGSVLGKAVDTGSEASHIQVEAVSFGSKMKSGSEHTGLPDPVLPKTPGISSLQERIKKKLKDNVGQKSPAAPGSIMEQLRERVLERVQLEAEMLKAQPVSDIGPFYGLPSKVKQMFQIHRGISALYSWQEECLNLPAIKDRKNLVYSLPTSGGKTLVAEILILRELLCQKRDALLILPFVSIVQEKVRNMAQFAVDLNFHVEEYAGSKGRFPPVCRRNNNSLFIATIEKAQSIINSLVEMDKMDRLGLVVVDELHMIGEGGSRGATLESTLMKILHAAGPAQIIGMSATLSNIQDLTQFLDAQIYSNDFRPVKLTEHIKLSDNIYKVDTAAKCPEDQIIHDRVTCFQYPPEMEKTDPDHLLGLLLEIIPDNSCLIFCPTKKNCENVALMLCKLMAKYKRELSNVKEKERKALLKELYNDSDGKICPVLQYTIRFGVAYHHSGLTVDERKLVEEAYSGGVLCMLACTSTLAAGVNLPAKRVILRSPYVGKNFISRSQYKQMSGRAGRAGIDSTGESIVVCKTGDREKVLSLLSAPLERCHSSLVYDGGRGMRTLILSTIGLKITTTTEDVFKIMSRSLASIQEKSLNLSINDLCRDCLQKLVDLELVIQTKTQSEDPGQNLCHSLEVTDLGKATVKGPIDPEYSNRLYADLRKGKESLVIASHLHLLYLVTPYDTVKDVTPSWFIYFNQMSCLTAHDLKVASLIGVPESYIAKQASQQRCRQKINEFTVKRFYLTLMLYELWNQRSVWEVAERFEQPRGFVQSLLSSAASFANCVQHFCQELEEFWAYQDLMGNFVKRLSYCVTAELIPLVEIPGVKMGRAKLMYTAGYKTLSSVANADVESLVKSVQYMPRKVARQIIASAKLLLSEKAEAMMDEVEHLVSIPEGTAVPVTVDTMKTPVATETPSFSQVSVDNS